MKSKPITYRIFSITMALLMFFTSAGFTVDLHYCQGQMKTFSFLGKAKSCHEVGEGMKNCPHHKKMIETGKTEGTTMSKKDCCSNKTFNVQSDQNQQYQVQNTIELSSSAQYFLFAYAEVFLKDAVSEIQNPVYAHYKPPLIPRDIYVLLETFRL